MATKLLERFRSKEGAVFPATMFEDKALTYLASTPHSWKGNVRMLKNLVETWVASSDTATIPVADVMQLEGAEAQAKPEAHGLEQVDDLPTYLAKLELQFILDSYTQHAGNKTAVVKHLYPGKQSNHFRRVVYDCFNRYPEATSEFPELVPYFEAEASARKGRKSKSPR